MRSQPHHELSGQEKTASKGFAEALENMEKNEKCNCYHDTVAKSRIETRAFSAHIFLDLSPLHLLFKGLKKGGSGFVLLL